MDFGSQAVATDEEPRELLKRLVSGTRCISQPLGNSSTNAVAEGLLNRCSARRETDAPSEPFLPEARNRSCVEASALGGLSVAAAGGGPALRSAPVYQTGARHTLAMQDLTPSRNELSRCCETWRRKFGPLAGRHSVDGRVASQPRAMMRYASWRE